MELIVGMMDLTLFGNAVWIVLGLPLLLVMGGVTLVASVRRRGIAGPTNEAAPTTPFARPARVLALSVVVVAVLALAARDVVRKRFIAGRDTWFTYTMMIVAQVGVLVLAAASGIPGQLLGW